MVCLPAGCERSRKPPDGALWFGTETGGVVRRETDGQCCHRWGTAEGLPSNDVRALLPDGDKGLWVGTASGLVYLAGDEPAVVEQVPRKTIWALAAGGSAAAGQDGSLWVSTEDEGIWERDRSGAWSRLADGLTSGQSFALLADREGRILVGTDNGLIYDAGAAGGSAGAWQRWLLRSSAGVGPEGDSGLRVFAIVPDADGGLWIGTDEGLYYEPDGAPGGAAAIAFLAQRNGLANNYVRAMAFDGEGALWLGTIAGVSRYQGQIWQLIRDESLAGRRINAVLTDRAGRTWAGMEQNGLAMWDGARWQSFTSQSGLPPGGDRVVSLFEDSGGRIWVGTGDSVGYLDAAGKWRFFDQRAGVAGLPVYSFAEDAEGTLWLATEGGVSRWTEATGFQSVAELAGKRADAVYSSRDGALWIGTYQDGIWRLAHGQLQAMAAPEGASFKIVGINGITAGPDGAVWVDLYDDGLWRYADGTWQRMDAALATPKILSLGLAQESLWVGTRVGLDRYDGRTWQSYVGDVLPSPEVLAIAPGDQGTVWIGTKGGLVHYRPASGASSQPWVRVESLNFLAPRDGKVALVGNTLNAVRLEGGDVGTRSAHMMFLTQLEGIDPAPQVHSDDLVSYSDLALRPGAYLLRAWARDADMNYSLPAEVVVAVPVVVRLPGGLSLASNVFYPGLALSVLALGGLAAAGGVSLASQARVRRQRVEEMARQRAAVERRFNPYISGEPVREPDMFFGRDELLAKILNTLHQNSIMIHGERRMGKTTLLYQLAEHLRTSEDPKWVFMPVTVDLEGTPEDRFFYVLMDAIAGVLRAYLVTQPPELLFENAAVAEYTDMDFATDLRALIEPLRELVAPRNVRVVLLMDEMDVINTYSTLTQQQLRRVFMSPQAQNLGAVVAGTGIGKAWDRVESPWYNLFNELSLDPFSEEDARAPCWSSRCAGPTNGRRKPWNS